MNSIEAIDRELERLHKELSSYTETEGEYLDVLQEVTRVNKLLAVLALKEQEYKERQINVIPPQAPWNPTGVGVT